MILIVLISLIRDRRVKLETYILNEFLVLEEANSFSKAAKQLQISQATLSRHIKQLEDEYGVVLFERTTQKMKLTPYGESLVNYARYILENERAFRRDIERIKFKKTNHLVIGTVDFPFYYGITALLASFKKERPNATLEVHLAPADDLIQMLDSGKIDVAFARNISNIMEHYHAFLYAEDYVRIAVPANHPLAGQETARIEQFADDIFYNRYRKNSLMDQLFSSMFRDAGIFPRISASEGNWEDSVINDINTVTTCMGGLAENFKGNVHVKVLTIEPKRHADIWLAAPKNSARSEITENFFQFVKSNLQTPTIE